MSNAESLYKFIEMCQVSDLKTEKALNGVDPRYNDENPSQYYQGRKAAFEIVKEMMTIYFDELSHKFLNHESQS